jgi:probable ATP-dependent RNA helicase DDX4
MQAAFLLPIINKLLSHPTDLVLTEQHCEPHAVIISPTRELTLQIFHEARKFAYGSVVRTVVAYGGTSTYHQAQDIMVSTLLQLRLNVKVTDLSKVLADLNIVKPVLTWNLNVMKMSLLVISFLI